MIHTPKNILKTTTAKNQTTYILKDETFIGNSFKYLPNGRIDKRVTGIGATYCELYSKRNSIIVEPLRAIASSKVEKHTGKETHTVIYVGGPTNVHPALKLHIPVALTPPFRFGLTPLFRFIDPPKMLVTFRSIDPLGK